jgi:hypothetical protein
VFVALWLDHIDVPEAERQRITELTSRVSRQNVRETFRFEGGREALIFHACPLSALKQLDTLGFANNSCTAKSGSTISRANHSLAFFLRLLPPHRIVCILARLKTFA